MNHVDELIEDSEPERECDQSTPSSLRRASSLIHCAIETDAPACAASSARQKRRKPWDLPPTTSTPPSPSNASPDAEPRPLKRLLSLPSSRSAASTVKSASEIVVTVRKPAKAQSAQRPTTCPVSHVNTTPVAVLLLSSEGPSAAPSSTGFESASSLLRRSLRESLAQEADRDDEATSTDGAGPIRLLAPGEPNDRPVRAKFKRKKRPITVVELDSDESDGEIRPARAAERRSFHAMYRRNGKQAEAQSTDTGPVDTSVTPSSISNHAVRPDFDAGLACNIVNEDGIERIRTEWSKFTYSTSQALHPLTCPVKPSASLAAQQTGSIPKRKARNTSSTNLPQLPLPADPIELPPISYIPSLLRCPLCDQPFRPSLPGLQKADHLRACAHRLELTALTVLIRIENVLLALGAAKERERRIAAAGQGLFQRTVLDLKSDVTAVGWERGRVGDLQVEIDALRRKRPTEKVVRLAREIRIARDIRGHHHAREHTAIKIEDGDDGEGGGGEWGAPELAMPRPTGSLTGDLVQTKLSVDARLAGLLALSSGTGLTQADPSSHLVPGAASVKACVKRESRVAVDTWSAVCDIRVEPDLNEAPRLIQHFQQSRVRARSRVHDDAMAVVHTDPGKPDSRWAAAAGHDDELIRRRVVDLDDANGGSSLPDVSEDEETPWWCRPAVS